MRRLTDRSPRRAAVPCLLALVLLVSACQSADIAPRAAGTNAPKQTVIHAPPPHAKSAPPPVAAAPQPPVLREALPPPGQVAPAAPMMGQAGMGAPLALEPPPASAVAPPVVAPAVLPPLAPLPGGAGAVKAALLLPLSGPSAHVGNALFNAAQMALFETAGEAFTLLPFDTKGTPEGASAAAAHALSQGVGVILGPVFSAEVKAVGPLARAASVPVLSFSTDRAAAGDGVYVLGFLPQPQVDRVVGYARAQGRSKFAVLAPASDYGRTVADSARAAVQRLGATLTRVEFYDPKSADASEAVKKLTRFDARKAMLADKIKALGAKTDEASKQQLQALGRADTLGDVPFDALLIADEGARLRNAAALLAYYDADGDRVKLLGTLLWDDPRVAGEPALIGGWFPAPPLADRQAFEQRYGAAFRTKPTLIATLAYDATALAAALARQPNPDYSAAALTVPTGFAGVDGLFRLLPDGTAQRGYAVMEVAPGAAKEIDLPPQAFEAVQY